MTSTILAAGESV